jgi:hypothetical protein
MYEINYLYLTGTIVSFMAVLVVVGYIFIKAQDEDEQDLISVINDPIEYDDNKIIA